jgi:ABC-type spermidine/putrescine transport systems, ATPase components
VIVTHDQDEALSMATHVAVMNQGRILQIDDPVPSTNSRGPASSPISSAR